MAFPQLSYNVKKWWPVKGPVDTHHGAWNNILNTELGFPAGLSNAYPVAGFEYFIVDANLSDKGAAAATVIKSVGILARN